MVNHNVALSRPIRLGKTTTVIAGWEIANDAYFRASDLARMFGSDIPFPTECDGSASVRKVAQYLRHLGIDGLRAMRDESS